MDDVLSELWVFGYGSLMWRPGFSYEEQVPGLLKGAHRALCIYSVIHRGTPEQPGLVLGLDRGGACRGVAFRVTPGTEGETRAYLKAREQVTDVYREALRPIRLLDGSGRRVQALCYLVNRANSQYAGRLPLDEQWRIVMAGEGQAGPNADYVLNTVEHLSEAGVHDPILTDLAVALRSRS